MCSERKTYIEASSVSWPLIKVSNESKPSTDPFTTNIFTSNSIDVHILFTESNTSASQKITDGSERRRIGAIPSKISKKNCRR